MPTKSIGRERYEELLEERDEKIKQLEEEIKKLQQLSNAKGSL